MTIAKRLAASYLTLCVVVGSLGYAGVRATRKVADSFEGNEEQSRAVSESAMAVIEHAKKAEARLLSFILLEDPVDRGEFFASIDKLHKRISNLERIVQTPVTFRIVEAMRIELGTMEKNGAMLLEERPVSRDLADFGRAHQKQALEFQGASSRLRQLGGDLNRTETDFLTNQMAITSATEVHSFATRAQGHLFFYLIFGDPIDRRKFFQRCDSLDEQIAVLEQRRSLDERADVVWAMRPNAEKLRTTGTRLLQMYDQTIQRGLPFQPQEQRELIKAVQDATVALRRGAVRTALLALEIGSRPRLLARAAYVELQRTVILAALIALALSVLLGILLTRSIVLPLRRLGKAAAEIGSGKLNTRVPVSSSSSDEISDLDEAFNGMAASLEKSNADLMRTQRELVVEQNRTSLGRLAASVTHEFNNVLMSIQPFVDLILKRAEDNEHVRSAARFIGTSVQRGKRITQEILRFAQPSEPVLTVLDVAHCVEVVGVELAAVLGTSIQVDIDVRNRPVSVTGDVVQFHQVLTNLAVNARDAMPSGGTLTVLVERCQRSSLPWAAAGTSDEVVHLAMTDTGVGMTEETKRRIFEPFYTTKKSGGTGLGLAVTQQIISSHDGQVHVESTVGKGTTFHFALPAVATEGAEEVAALPQAVATAQRVLLVDDEESLTTGLAALLEMENIAVETVHLGLEAVSAATRFHPDAVILDVGLPDVSGVEVYRALKARWPDLLVVFSTGQGDHRSTLQEYLSEPTVRLLLKPYSIDDLLRALMH